MKIRIMSFVSLLVLGIANPANAELIEQSESTNSMGIIEHGPIGQSFIAPDPFVFFAFRIGGAGCHREAEAVLGLGCLEIDPLELIILAGDGMNGSVLGSFSSTPINDRIDGFFEFDISAIALNVGQSYTAVLVEPDAPGQHWAAGINDDASPGYQGDAYADGRAYFDINSGWHFEAGPGDDFAFRISPAAVGVPEPATLALLGIGLAGIRFSRRIRNPNSIS